MTVNITKFSAISVPYYRIKARNTVDKKISSTLISYTRHLRSVGDMEESYENSDSEIAKESLFWKSSVFALSLSEIAFCYFSASLITTLGETSQFYEVWVNSGIFHIT